VKKLGEGGGRDGKGWNKALEFEKIWNYNDKVRGIREFVCLVLRYKKAQSSVFDCIPII
jgi:hypothetical protein